MPAPSAPRFRVDYAVLSDIGMRRANNQDSVVAVAGDDAKGRGSLFIVADGMGAHAAGELASKMAVNNVPLELTKLKDQSVSSALRQAVQMANGLIHAKGQSSPEFHGMGTTCTSVVITGGVALVAHVGDSRVYRARAGHLEQLTFDHSLVWELAEASQTTADKVPSCIPKNVITRSLGPHSVVNVDLEGPFDLREGDTFILCSDGLTGVVEDELIGAVLEATPPEDAAQTLIDLANLRGGPDNISVIVIRIGESLEVDEPCTLGQRSDPLQWIAIVAAAVCLAIIIWCIREQHTWGAVLAAIGLGGAAVRALGRNVVEGVTEVANAIGGPYGNGPYRRFDCNAGDKTTGALKRVLDELSELRSRTADQNGAAAVDWQQFDAQRALAEQSNDWREQVRSYATAVRDLMAQVRSAPGLAEKTLGAPSSDNALRD